MDGTTLVKPVSARTFPEPTDSRDLGDEFRNAAVDQVDLFAEELIVSLDSADAAGQGGILLGSQFAVGGRRCYRGWISPTLDRPHEVRLSTALRSFEASSDLGCRRIRISVRHPFHDERIS